ncbi:hypothetical protein VDGL01_04585 [Verticillium dahliae]
MGASRGGAAVRACRSPSPGFFCFYFCDVCVCLFSVSSGPEGAARIRGLRRVWWPALRFWVLSLFFCV